MVVIPVTNSVSLLNAYRITENKLRSWPYAFAGILAILINWIWNLMKYT